MDVPKSDYNQQDKYFSENSEMVEEQVQKAISELTEDDKLAMAMK